MNDLNVKQNGIINFPQIIVYQQQPLVYNVGSASARVFQGSQASEYNAPEGFMQKDVQEELDELDALVAEEIMVSEWLADAPQVPNKPPRVFSSATKSTEEMGEDVHLGYLCKKFSDELDKIINAVKSIAETNFGSMVNQFRMLFALEYYLSRHSKDLDKCLILKAKIINEYPT